VNAYFHYYYGSHPIDSWWPPPQVRSSRGRPAVQAVFTYICIIIQWVWVFLTRLSVEPAAYFMARSSALQVRRGLLGTSWRSSAPPPHRFLPASKNSSRVWLPELDFVCFNFVTFSRPTRGLGDPTQWRS
jgi:hypothetical protein